MKQSNLFKENTNNIFNGEQLRLARLAAGKSLIEVGQSLGVTRQYAYKLEAGATPSEEQVSALAKLLSVSENFFFGMRRRPIEAEQCNFRSLRSSTQTIKKLVMAQVEMFADQIILQLDEEIEFPEVKIPDIGDDQFDTVSQIETLAERFRRELGLGLGPISNVIKFAESIGCLVLNLAEADERVDAFSLCNGRPLIARNTAKQSPCRLRFDIAHEIGHLLMHQGIATGCRKTEEQANNFASAFLMPRTSFSAEFPRMRGRNFNWNALTEMKIRWGVSYKALIYRASKLNLISAEKANSGFKFLSRSGYTKSERNDDKVPAEQPSVIQRAINMLDYPTWRRILKSSGITEEILIHRYLLSIPKPHLKSV